MGGSAVFGCVLVCACASDPAPPPRVAEDCGAWRAGPKLLDFRENSPVIALDDGRVLVAGGHFKGRGLPVDTSEIVDVAANTSVFTGPFTTSRTVVGISGTVMLPDRRVLTVSPYNLPTDATVASEVWSAMTGAWSVAGTMKMGGGPAVALADGRVLVAGGIDWSMDAPLARTEIWSAGTWSTSGPMTTPRTGHALLLLPSGEPIAIGGFARYPDGAGVGTSEIFDLATSTWGRVATMTDRRAPAAVLLADGRVLAAGGTNESGGYKQQLKSAEIYDPKTNTWTAVGAMEEERSRFDLTLLADGRVLATGGGQDSFVTAVAEIFDPQTGTWSQTKPMATGRGGHHAVRLKTNEVLVVGGFPGSYTTEIYTPCVK
jgi:hypothetical protein